MQQKKITLKLTIMKTYIIVKASSKRYHIYTCAGDCLATVPSRMEVFSYLNEAFYPSSCITFKRTAVSGTFIVTMY